MYLLPIPISAPEMSDLIFIVVRDCISTSNRRALSSMGNATVIFQRFGLQDSVLCLSFRFLSQLRSFGFQFDANVDY